MKYFRMIDALYLHAEARANVAVTKLLTAVVHILSKGGKADCSCGKNNGCKKYKK